MVETVEEQLVHIIVIEDDAQLGAAIRRVLTQLSYTVTLIRHGTEGLRAIRDQSADVVLIDLGLPGKDGLDILKEIRAAHIRTPVIVMTARDAVEARIRGLDAGADDYLVKPFHLDELAARIRALARRSKGLADNHIEVGAIDLNLSTFEVAYRGQPVELTRREFALLQILIERAGRIVQRQTLENSLYGIDGAQTANALEVLVHALRRKLSFEAIQTVRGFGYMIPRDPR
ncbi:two-component system response regulator QseB [Luteibacter sp. Sphag1AF]|nr:two-component system response regulator QseB [Luteibacter sp. Sphag1AF]